MLNSLNSNFTPDNIEQKPQQSKKDLDSIKNKILDEDMRFLPILIETKKLMDEIYDLVLTIIEDDVNSSLKVLCLETFEAETGLKDYRSLKDFYKKQLKEIIHGLNKENFGSFVSEFYAKMHPPTAQLKATACNVSKAKLEELKKAEENLSRKVTKFL